VAIILKRKERSRQSSSRTYRSASVVITIHYLGSRSYSLMIDEGSSCAKSASHWDMFASVMCRADVCVKSICRASSRGGTSAPVLNWNDRLPSTKSSKALIINNFLNLRMLPTTRPLSIILKNWRFGCKELPGQTSPLLGEERKLSAKGKRCKMIRTGH
jgi:hypothetical protein